MALYTYTGSAQFVTVTATNTYHIGAYGAQGGNVDTVNSGGLGAYVGGKVALTAGEKLEIIVGGQGNAGGAYDGGGGGGGGTFVLEVNGNGSYTPLLIAGGGGGGGYAALKGGAGNSATTANSAGQPGGGGSAFNSTSHLYSGGGGTGENQIGTPSSGQGGGGGFNRSGNYAGGAPADGGSRGGFGGGGGAAYFGAGGGGGYSGGNGGDTATAAGGGSSFVASSFSNVVRQSGFRNGNGIVSISPQAGTPGTPTATSIYDTSAGTNAKGAATAAGKTFGFSFTTTSAAELSSFKIGVDNPGGGSGTVAFYLESNASNNTPGKILDTFPTVNDSQISGATTVSDSGIDYALTANTQYWLVGVNSATSNITEVADNASPGIGYADEYTYDSSQSTTGSFANATTPVDGQIVVIACYCPGTLILTNRGEMPVEILAIGDTVVTASGEHRPIKWIGRRSYAGRFLAANPGVQPIRFRAGSLGAGLPRRDLLVSPDHAMALDGLLIPARCLINGATIVQERGLRRVEYHHVELDSHDVLLAEGAPSESFVDDGSRFMFRNAAEFAALYPDAPRPDGFCAPRVESGFQLEAIRARLGGLLRTSLLAA